MRRFLFRTALAIAVPLPVAALAADPVGSSSTASLPINVTAIGMFLVFVLATVTITYWASKRTRNATQFLTAGGSITGFQNGLAIAGDAVSASTVLGLVSFIYTTGFDGLVSSVGFFVGWPMLLLLMADRMRNLGHYTFADVVSFRLDPKPMRCLAAGCGLIVVLFYLIIQIVGAGELVTLLFGLDYPVAVAVVGLLTGLYVIVGGMVATTWVQIVKATLLLLAITLLTFLVLSRFGFSFEALAAKAVASHHGDVRTMGPGSFLGSPVSALSVAIGSVCGVSGLPHILMRFFTVPDAKAARMSVFYATGMIGYGFLVSGILGVAGMSLVGGDPQFFEQGQIGGRLLGGPNMISLFLAKLTGGDLLFGFLAAVLFATILAVVSGLVIAGAAAISHDLYANVFRSGRTTEDSELRVTKLATLCLCVVMVVLGIAFRGLPGPASVNVLARPHDPRSIVGWVDGALDRAGTGDPRARGVDRGPRPPHRRVPLRRAGPVLDAAGIPDGLGDVGHGWEQPGGDRTQGVRWAVRACPHWAGCGRTSTGCTMR